MIAKVIVWDESRFRAISKMRQTLMETVFFGVHTNIPYLQAILAHPEFVEGKMTTRFIDNYFANGIEFPKDEHEAWSKIIESIQGSIPDCSFQSSGGSNEDSTQIDLRQGPWFVGKP